MGLVAGFALSGGPTGARTRWRSCSDSGFGIACGCPDGRRPDPQAAAGAGPGRWRGVGLADDLAVRERRWPVPSTSWRVDAGHRAASAPAGRAGAADHDRPGSDRRRARAQQLTFFNGRSLVLPAVAGVSDLRQGTRTVSVRGGAAARQCAGHPRDRGRVVPAAAPAAAGLSPGADPDGGFATPEIFDAEPRLDYVVAMARKCCSATPSPPCSWRRPRARPAARPRRLRRHPFRARTGTATAAWLIKAEVVRLGDRAPRDNPRFA